MDKDEKPITIQSMVGARTGEPAVMIRFGEEFANVPVADARRVALDILNAALAAEQDAALVTYFRGQGLDDTQVARLLTLIREVRQV